MTTLALAFDGQFLKITDAQDEGLRKAFPWIDVQAQYRVMDSWCLANPRRQPKNHARFAQIWLSKVRQREWTIEDFWGLERADLTGWWVRCIRELIRWKDHRERSWQLWLKENWKNIPEEAKEMLRQAMRSE